VHAEESVTNYCQGCEMLICPICVEEHSDRQLKHRIMAISSALKKAGAKLMHLDEALNKKTLIDFELEKSGQKTLATLERMKAGALALVSSHFDTEISKVNSILSLSAEPSPDLTTKIKGVQAELSLMHRQMQQPATVASTLSKIFRLDHKSLLEHLLGRNRISAKVMRLNCEH
jgi:hypothetical protein